MKRHLSLVPFSREHHGALILSRLLQKGTPAYKDLPNTIAGKAAYATAFFQENLLTHFQAEESCLVSILKGKDALLDVLLMDMVAEHTKLTDLFRAIPATDKKETLLDSTGKLLEKHIRKEEREIFPLIEKLCDDGILAKISATLTSFTHEKRH